MRTMVIVLNLVMWLNLLAAFAFVCMRPELASLRVPVGIIVVLAAALTAWSALRMRHSR
jgi:hypothetical protein